MPLNLERRSHCKINLLLNTLGLRPDGFHELETILHPIPVHDRIAFKRQGASLSFTCNVPYLPTDGRNLVVRAATAFLEAAGLREGVRLHLDKQIPVGAGVGGGSGNAAVTLLGLNDLFERPLDASRLAQVAATLGSDVPFFLQPGPALGTGRGETIVSLDPFPALRGVWAILVYPGFGVSTPWAYQQLARFPEARQGIPGRAAAYLEVLRQPNPAAAGQNLYNSLESPVLEKHPLLALFQDFFRQQGVLGTRMSGSGSTTFALVSTRAEGDQILERFKARFGCSFWTQVVPLPPGLGESSQLPG